MTRWVLCKQYSGYGAKAGWSKAQADVSRPVRRLRAQATGEITAASIQVGVMEMERKRPFNTQLEENFFPWTPPLDQPLPFWDDPLFAEMDKVYFYIYVICPTL